MNASLSEKLSAVKWGEFRLGDLFTKRTIKGVPKNKENLTPNKNGFHMFGQNIKYQYPQRILLDKKYLQSVDYQHPILGYTSSVGEIGIIKEPFYRSGDNGAFQGLFSKEHQFTLKELYFVLPILQKEFDKFGYDTSMANTINLQFSLPITSPGKIDFDFMESFIAELEAERVAELEAERVAELSAYLAVSGLDNYELSGDEVQALQNYSLLTWKSFNLECLFGKSTRGKRLKGDDRVSGTLPFVTAGEASEGISAYISNDVEIFEKNTTTIDMFGSAKYRNYKYGADDHIAVVHTETVPMKAAIFLTSAIHKAAHTGKFDYGHNFYAKDADALDIMLPAKDGKPDYTTMETLISAVQKLVIKEVVLYANQKIETTKAVTKRY